MSGNPIPTTVLGLGEMGSALAAALVDAGHPTTVWNRSPAKAEPLSARGAVAADTVEAAVSASPLTVACLLDDASVREVLDPVAPSLRGQALVNLTTTTLPAGEFAARAAPFLAAMTGAFAGYAATIDAADYAGEGQQSLEFSDLTRIVTASVEQGVSAEVLQPVHEMVQRQIAAGHGTQGFARTFEELRSTP
jgi:pyrroline-5-carboxylate reductase